MIIFRKERKKDESFYGNHLCDNTIKDEDVEILLLLQGLWEEAFVIVKEASW